MHGKTRATRAVRRLQFVDRMSRPGIAVLAAFGLLVLVASASGCGGSGSICDFRGGPDTYTGSETYTLDAQLNLSTASTAMEPFPSGYFGTSPTDTNIDWDPYAQRREDGHFCDQTGDGFQITTTDCRFDAHVTSTNYQNGGGLGGAGNRPLISATAAITGGTCAFFVPGGAAKVIIKSGTVSWPDLENVHLEAIGDVETWTFNLNDHLPDTRQVSVKFDGATNHANESQ
jgi:hypothetical protein